MMPTFSTAHLHSFLPLYIHIFCPSIFNAKSYIETLSESHIMLSFSDDYNYKMKAILKIKSFFVEAISFKVITDSDYTRHFVQFFKFSPHLFLFLPLLHLHLKKK